MLDTNPCKQTKNNVNKTLTTGGKDEPNIIVIRASQRGVHDGLIFSTSYKTFVVLLIYTVQSGKRLCTHMIFNKFIT